jgi:hypothetical protein
MLRFADFELDQGTYSVATARSYISSASLLSCSLELLLRSLSSQRRSFLRHRLRARGGRRLHRPVDEVKEARPGAVNWLVKDSTPSI